MLGDNRAVSQADRDPGPLAGVQRVSDLAEQPGRIGRTGHAASFSPAWLSASRSHGPSCSPTRPTYAHM